MQSEWGKSRTHAEPHTPTVRDMRTFVGSLTAGDHVCATYRSARDRDAIVASFIHAARADGWLTVSLDRDATAEVYGDRPTTDPEGLVADFERHARDAVANGYRGLALVSDPTSLVVTAESRAAFARVEHLADRMVRTTKIITGLCLYDAEALGDVAIDDIGALHRRAWPNDTSFHVCCCDAGGLTIDGELDLSTLDALERALTAASNSSDEITVDVESLTFIDHRSLEVIDRLAAERHQTVVLVRAQPIVARLMEFTDTPHVVLDRN